MTGDGKSDGGTARRGNGAGGPARVVILGGGFGGLTAARALAHAPVTVRLIDRTNHHLFQPLLYQVAMAGLSPADIASPIRSILRAEENVTVLLAEAMRIDPDAHKVILEREEVPYDFLIVATGARTSYFGHREWEGVAPGLKSVDDAVEIRQRVLLAFEQAERESDDARRAELLSFVVIGGGPTGVELAGALAELSRFVLARDFRHINPKLAEVRLIEAGPRILPTFSEDLSASAVKQLEDLGVKVQADARVTNIDERGVYLGEQFVPASIVIWGAGVEANPITQSLGVKTDRTGRVEVNPDLTIPGHPDVFVIGDAALFLHQGGKPLPGVSPVAMQQARAVAKSIERTLEGKPREPFHYFDKGSMATIGRSRAIAEVKKLHLHGFIAWLSWLFVHIWYLIGFRNRFVVMFTWFWSYVTYRRGARLITGYGSRPSRAVDQVRVPAATRREERPSRRGVAREEELRVSAPPREGRRRSTV